ncbi:MAG: hypothetical protein HYU66_01975 [Armatimonadetes bacterium]|nr:hypothetical protein [Armatimonadota bacterium]
MLRWLALSLCVTVAWAGSFDKVPSGSACYADLAMVRDAGLGRTSLVKNDGHELTRFECAMIWNAAYQELRERSAGDRDSRATPEPRVQQVANAMRRLLDTFEAEIVTLDVDLSAAKVDLARAPYRLSSLSGSSRSAAGGVRDLGPELPSAAVRSGFRDPALDLRAGSGRLGLSVTHRDLPFVTDAVSDDVRARVGARLFGDTEAGLSWRQMQITEHDRFGPSQFLVGHVLAADLRLRLGDDSVILEYGRSLAEDYLRETAPSSGQSYRATWLRQFGDRLSFDLGYRRMSSGYTALDDLFPGETSGDLQGVEAGVAWHPPGLGLTSRAAYYRPSGGRDGFVNQLGAAMQYQPGDRLQLSLFYQTTNRRGLLNLEDAWQNLLEARVAYGVSSRLHADLGYRFKTSERSGRSTRDEHVVGASLGLDF